MLRFVVVLVASWSLALGTAGASSFAVESSAFLNGGTIPRLDAAHDQDCGGRNVSPPLELSGAPAAARSLAVVVFDPDAGAGHGFTHWVAYGIDPKRTLIPSGFGSQPSDDFTGGTNDAGTQLYFGPCPPPGDPAHHYVFSVYALDVAPGGLAPGLSRGAFLKASARHVLAVATVTGRYGR